MAISQRSDHRRDARQSRKLDDVQAWGEGSEVRHRNPLPTTHKTNGRRQGRPGPAPPPHTATTVKEESGGPTTGARGGRGQHGQGEGRPNGNARHAVQNANRRTRSWRGSPKKGRPDKNLNPSSRWRRTVAPSTNAGGKTAPTQSTAGVAFYPCTPNAKTRDCPSTRPGRTFQAQRTVR